MVARASTSGRALGLDSGFDCLLDVRTVNKEKDRLGCLLLPDHEHVPNI